MKNNLPLDEIQKEAHQIAVEKGWWEEGKNKDNFGNQCTNFHAEATEAWEECRNGHEMNEIYYNYGNPKPEGVPIEFADLVIRFLDTSGGYKKHLTPYMKELTSNNVPDSVGDQFALLHELISAISSEIDFEVIEYSISEAIRYVYDLCDHHNIDLHNAIKLKMAYNRTRPKHHGGKRC